MSVFRLPFSASGKKQKVFASSADRNDEGVVGTDRFSERLNQIRNRIETLEDTASFDIDGAIAVAFLREDCKFLIEELQRSIAAPSA